MTPTVARARKRDSCEKVNFLIASRRFEGRLNIRRMMDSRLDRRATQARPREGGFAGSPLAGQAREREATDPRGGARDAFAPATARLSFAGIVGSSAREVYAPETADLVFSAVSSSLAAARTRNGLAFLACLPDFVGARTRAGAIAERAPSDSMVRENASRSRGCNGCLQMKKTRVER